MSLTLADHVLAQQQNPDQLIVQIPAIDEERNQELEDCLQAEEEGIDFGPPADFHRMDLSLEEVQWALAIKAAITKEKKLGNLSDYMYCQLALICKEDVEGALQRAHGLQAFREDFDIVETVAAGKRALRECFKIFPDYFLSFGYYQEGGNYSLAYDTAKMTREQLKHAGALGIWMKAFYYLWHAGNCDLEAIRKGLFLMCECDGFEFRKHFGMKEFTEMWTRLGLVYPLQINKIKHYHTNVVVNTLVSMGKNILSKDVRDKFDMGNICELGRLSDLYLLPNLESAQGRLLKRFEGALTLRYENEKLVSLSVV